MPKVAGGGGYSKKKKTPKIGKLVIESKAMSSKSTKVKPLTATYATGIRIGKPKPKVSKGVKSRKGY